MRRRVKQSMVCRVSCEQHGCGEGVRAASWSMAGEGGSGFEGASSEVSRFFPTCWHAWVFFHREVGVYVRRSRARRKVTEPPKSISECVGFTVVPIGQVND